MSDTPEITQDGKYLVCGTTKVSPYSYTIHFVVDELKAEHRLLDTGLGFGASLTGQASIEKFSSLQVLGLENTKCTSVDLIISPATEDHLRNLHAEQDSSAEELGWPHVEIPKPLSWVSLWFQSADAELRIKEGWTIQISLRSQDVEQLLNVIQTGRVRNAAFGIEMVGVYVEHEHAPVSFPQGYYLKPDKHSGSQMVHGSLRYFRTWEGAHKLNLRAMQDVDERTRNESDPTTIDSIESLYRAIQVLAVELKRIAKVATWIAVILVIIAIFVYRTH